MSLWPPLSVAECWFDPNKKELNMSVRCKGKCFQIALSPDYFHESPEILKKYLRFTEVAEADGDLDGLTIDDFQDWALEPFLPVLRDTELAWEETHIFNLHDYLNPETFHYSLSAVNGKLIPSLDCNATPASQLGVKLDDHGLHPCSLFLPRQIQICVDRPEDIYFETPKKVLVDGKTVCFFKQWGTGEKRGALRELKSYKRIGKLLGTEVRTPHLHGVVQGDEDCRYLGLLLSWIDCQYMTLECAVQADTPITLRRKWADQLTASLNHLHRAGVIWGDAKPANILVDANNDIWIIDFGGGYTRGWVERGIAGTIEGDTQGDEVDPGISKHRQERHLLSKSRATLISHFTIWIKDIA